MALSTCRRCRRAWDRLIVSGVSGVILLPLLGENASLTLDERAQVLTAAKEAVAGRVPMLSGLAEVSSRAAAEAAELMKSWAPRA